MIPLPTMDDDWTPAMIEAAPEREQLAWMHALSRREMEALYERGGTIDLAHFVGDGTTILEHEGQNSLPPGIDRFEKHFVRRGDVVQGYNKGAWAWLIGPGHFVVRQDGDQLIFDYTQLPPDAPAQWPPLKPNTAGLSRFVYGGTTDIVRKVTDRMCVGKAFRGTTPVGAFFMLYRR